MVLLSFLILGDDKRPPWHQKSFTLLDGKSSEGIQMSFSASSRSLAASSTAILFVLNSSITPSLRSFVRLRLTVSMVMPKKSDVQFHSPTEENVSTLFPQIPVFSKGEKILGSIPSPLVKPNILLMKTCKNLRLKSRQGGNLPSCCQKPD